MAFIDHGLLLEGPQNYGPHGWARKPKFKLTSWHKRVARNPISPFHPPLGVFSGTAASEA
ncbi:hypothetical protein CRG98_012248, partial [Punica granatum]